MTSQIIRIGTRGSKLALAQAHMVSNELKILFPQVGTEIIVMKTSGDVKLEEALWGRLDKGFFTSEIEQALLDHQIDMAVHSLKDLPVEIPSGLAIGAMLPRANPLDVCISRDNRQLHQLKDGDVVATSSLRRKTQLLARYPNLKVIDIRGNVDTRMRKLHDGVCDVLVLAAAGIERLGMSSVITEQLPVSMMVPAPGQGVIAIEARVSDTHTNGFIKQLNHYPTQEAVTIERLFLNELGGGCHIPVGCFCELPANGERILHVFVSNPDGSSPVRKTYHLSDNYAVETPVLSRTLLAENTGKILLKPGMS
jgi:hydroxymethylbilane synthase